MNIFLFLDREKFSDHTLVGKRSRKQKTQQSAHTSGRTLTSSTPLLRTGGWELPVESHNVRLGYLIRLNQSMTSLATAIAIDQRGPSALYIVTDSRITWKGFAGEWDAGQKTFSSQQAAHVFGFCGNAVFPPTAIRQIVELIDLGVISGCSVDIVHKRVLKFLNQSLKKASNKFFDGFSIFHGARQDELMKSQFRLWKTDYYMKTNKFYDIEIPIESSQSCFVKIDGSGRSVIENRLDVWKNSKAGGTSRAAIWAFCEALAAGSDPATGGAPQLVGIWRKGPARRFGLLWEGKKYIAGIEVNKPDLLSQVDWFNNRFERCEGVTGKRIEGAAIHQKPTTIFE